MIRVSNCTTGLTLFNRLCNCERLSTLEAGTYLNATVKYRTEEWPHGFHIVIFFLHVI